MIKLKNKAKNLEILKKIFFKDTNIIIPKFYFFSVKNLDLNKKYHLKKILNFAKKRIIILRSSSFDEDTINYSNAGKYNSIILKKNITNNELKNILNKFLKQFKNKNDIIIVQEFIEKVQMSGVIFTNDINSNAPYYLINYDESGRTNLVTSGKKSFTHKQYVQFKDYEPRAKKFKKLIYACKKLEKKVNYYRLDIEFCIKSNKIYLLQVRFLPLANNKKSRVKLEQSLINIKKKIIKLAKVNPTLFGKKTIFSNMTDWNPVEMIGEKPSKLAISLYKELITDSVWRIQRKNYGYKDVFPNVLIFDLGGSPFVDLRTDINSFLPDKLNRLFSEKIINQYIDYIYKNTSLHDKIEFNVVETCYSINSKKRLKKILNKRSIDVYLGHLKELTRQIFKKKLLYKDIYEVQNFDDNLLQIKSVKKDFIQKIFLLVELTKKYGTLPFAGIARSAFISQRILIDLKENNLIDKNEFENFFNSLPSITKEMNKNFNNLKNKKELIKNYGHLRPSTYDITSLNYSEGFNSYFGHKSKYIVEKRVKFKGFRKARKINNLLKLNYNINLSEFLKFSKNSIYWREKSKFIFTKGINEVFINLILLGKEIRISRSDLQFLDIKNIHNYFSKLENQKLKETLLEEIKKNKKELKILKQIKLPDFIKSYQDIYSFYEAKTKINFITNNNCTGKIYEIKNKTKLKDLHDMIICIENADPGYDFIFNYKIKGLITKYGGSNSHMAIRCLEKNIPACIGVGKLIYDSVKISKNIYIDANNKVLKVI